MDNSNMFLELWWWLLLFLFTFRAYYCYKSGKECEELYLKHNSEDFKELRDDFYILAVSCVGGFIVLSILFYWVTE